MCEVELDIDKSLDYQRHTKCTGLKKLEFLTFEKDGVWISILKKPTLRCVAVALVHKIGRELLFSEVQSLVSLNRINIEKGIESRYSFIRQVADSGN